MPDLKKELEIKEAELLEAQKELKTKEKESKTVLEKMLADQKIEFEGSVNEKMEKARKEEKEKVYAKMKKLEDSKKEFEDKQTETEKKITELEDKLSGKKKTELSDTEKLKEEITQMKLDHENAIKDLNEKSVDADSKIKASNLSAFREKKLRAAGTEIIPELVSGDSEEAIDESITKAKEKYKSYQEAIKADLENDKKKTKTSQKTQPPGDDKLEITLDDIKKMDENEWAKKRKEILNQVKQKK